MVDFPMLPKLLVIDDEAGILDLVSEHFGLRGFEVHTADDGKEGIELCKQFQPQIILLDLKMRKMDGDQALPELRRQAPQAKIFIISAYQDETLQRRIAGLGVDACFEKPISILELEKAVRAALRGN
jgi:DNA-binding response OmpR family regulator